MVQFIDDHRAVFGVEPICAVLPIAPSTDSSPSAPADPSDAPVRAGAARRVSSASRFSGSMTSHQQVYGPRKVWKRAAAGRHPRGALHRGALDAREWASPGPFGAGPGSPRPTPVRAVARVDLVDRQFVATRPNQLWVSDSRTSRPGAASSTSRSSSTCLRDALWAGGCRPPCARTSCWMRWSRRSTLAGTTPSPASYITVMPGRNISPCGTRIASWTPASRRRSAAKAMPMTMPSPSR